MAKRTKSAIKANRQNIKRREHNRALRSKLRTGLKAIRKALDGKDIDGAKTQLKGVQSLVDKMAAKGIIHRNTASRYKSRIVARLAQYSRSLSPFAPAGRAEGGPAPRRSPRPHSSTTRRSSRILAAVRPTTSSPGPSGAPRSSAWLARASGRSRPAAARICPSTITACAPASSCADDLGQRVSGLPPRSPSRARSPRPAPLSGITRSRTCRSVTVDSPAA